MTRVANGNGKSPTPDYYNSGSAEASVDTALVIKRLEAVSIFLYSEKFQARFIDYFHSHTNIDQIPHFAILYLADIHIIIINREDD